MAERERVEVTIFLAKEMNTVPKHEIEAYLKEQIEKIKETKKD